MRLVIQKNLSNRNVSSIMASSNRRSLILPLGALALGSLASCSLPPGEAWREIQTRGLIPYVAAEVRGNYNNGQNRPSAAPVAEQKSNTAIAANTQAAPAPASSQSQIGPERPTAPVISGPSVPPPSQLSAATLPVAKPVEGLSGYVRSPFTNPPRLVDVRGMTAGSKVVCPYTRKPFLVPAGAQSAPEANIAANTKPTPVATPTPAPAPVTTPAPAPAPKVMQQPPSAPTQVAANTARSTPAPVTKPNPAPEAATKPAPTPPTQPAPAPSAPPAANEIPFGTAVAGRPGFVNSPFAAKHQLVDVTGLPTGMEVKCPYTGKLFRVPPQANKAQ